MRADLFSLAIAAFILPASCLATDSTMLAERSEAVPIYKNSSHCVDDRVEDLIRRMTIEEKAGQMFQIQLRQGPNLTFHQGNPSLNQSGTEALVGTKLMTHFNLLGDILDAKAIANFTNRVQKLAAETRLGIPITISTDPRHHFTDNVGTGFMAGVFSQWPETPGLAALRDPSIVKTFAEIAREEYLAVGIRAALHPQVDLATEPRWARVSGTWGEDADLTSELIVAYIQGFHGDKFGRNSVTTVTKHFPGGGPAENGEDSHFTYGKNATYPGGNLDYHLKPFRAAIKAGARQIMPYYARPIGTKYDEVGAAFNKGLITDLLRGEMGFSGIVVTDWGLITNSVAAGQPMDAIAWGVEHLTEHERMEMVIEAGCDQFGGQELPEMIVELVKAGRVSEKRIDVSVRRLLREKFVLGLFDNPYVDPDAAAVIVGNPCFKRIANETQRRSYTLLTNKEGILPLKTYHTGAKFYVEGLDAASLQRRNLNVVSDPKEANYALLRLAAPFEPRPGGFEAGFTAGSIEFNSTEKARQAKIYAALPTIVDLKFNRPVAIPEIVDQASAVLASYGSSNDAFLDVVFGVAEPEGKLPYDLPRSNKAAEESKTDVPFDTKDPVFKFGHGLRYNTGKCSGTTPKCGRRKSVE